MISPKYILLLISSFHIQSALGLECLNCFSKSRDLDDCEPLTIPQLRDKLRENEKYGRGPYIKVEQYDPDVCVLIDVELMDMAQNKVVDLVVVRTQIRKSTSKLFVDEKKVSEKCKIKNEIETGKQYSFTTKYCACTGDFCNGQTRLQSFSFYKILILIVGLLWFGSRST